MALQLDLDYTADLTPHEFERFANLIDPSWIDEALQQTGTVSLRRRSLPAEHMVWLVIGLALFRNEPIWHIVQQLDLADGPVLHAPVPSAAVLPASAWAKRRWRGCSIVWQAAGVVDPCPTTGCFMACAAMPSMA